MGWDVKMQNEFFQKLDELTARKDALTLMAKNVQSVVGERNTARWEREAGNGGEKGDGGSADGLTEQELVDLALALCSFLGLANTVVFLLEQHARVDATMQVCQYAKSGLRWRTRARRRSEKERLSLKRKSRKQDK